jgi:energy-converting hydrogenase Eha subunit E
MNLFVSVFWTALSTVLFFCFLRQRYQFSGTGAFWTSLVFGFCTLMFPFDGSLWGHTTAAAMILIGYYHLEQQQRLGLAGFMLGLAVLVEYMAAISLVVAAVYLLVLPGRRTQIVKFVAGAAPGIAALLVYHKICFGSFFTTAASLSDTLRRIEEGRAIAFGQFGSFQLDVFWKLLFSLERGIFIYMPVLLFAFVGALHLLRKRDTAWLAACVLNVLLYVGAISSYVFWDGGWSTGARYLIVALPFFCFLLPSPDSMGRKTLAIYIVLGAFSFMNMLAIATVEVMAPDWVNPLYGEVYPRFIAGHFNENRLFFESLRHWFNHQAITPNRFNLGQLLFNLRGHLSLIPWIAVTSVLGLMLYRSVMKELGRSSPREQVLASLAAQGEIVGSP